MPCCSFQLTAKSLYGFDDVPADAPGLMDNLLQLNVYFQSLNVRQIEEDPTYGPIQLIYALGGALSLYLGISLSMIFEVIELLFDICINLFTYCALSGRHNKKPADGRTQ